MVCLWNTRSKTDVAGGIGTWLKLSAVAVARARSDEANHVAESNGGEHWKKGCAAPTRIVPITSDGTNL